MGILGGILGPKHPPLPEGDPAAGRISDAGEVFESFVAKANDTIEVIPGEGPLYALVGKPPKAFGALWFENGERYDVRSLLEKDVITREAAVGLVNDLGRIYTSHAASERYSHTVGKHKVTVTPSSAFYSEVHEAVERATAS
jgi:hypothetical protein